jgi:hypothetical protein
MEVRYEWREITDDGLLKHPDIIGPYYDETELNYDGGYESEEYAIEDLKRYQKASGWTVELVLVKTYRVEREE